MYCTHRQGKPVGRVEFFKQRLKMMGAFFFFLKKIAATTKLNKKKERMVSTFLLRSIRFLRHASICQSEKQLDE